MQLVLPWLGASRKESRGQRAPAFIDVAGRTYSVALTRHQRARRYVMRMTAEGALRITVPRGASITGALAFAKGQGPWIIREHARRQVLAGAWTHGRAVWLRGAQVPLAFSDATITVGDQQIPRPSETQKVRSAVEQRMRTMATAELPGRCAELAALHGLTVNRISIRNQRSRWGSCSARGAIALNWRLIQMPAEVSDYVILHELMHLRQPNHSRQFWREVASVCSHWRDAEHWLKRHGPELL